MFDHFNFYEILLLRSNVDACLFKFSSNMLLHFTAYATKIIKQIHVSWNDSEKLRHICSKWRGWSILFVNILYIALLPFHHCWSGNEIIIINNFKFGYNPKYSWIQSRLFLVVWSKMSCCTYRHVHPGLVFHQIKLQRNSALPTLQGTVIIISVVAGFPVQNWRVSGRWLVVITASFHSSCYCFECTLNCKSHVDDKERYPTDLVTNFDGLLWFCTNRVIRFLCLYFKLYIVISDTKLLIFYDSSGVGTSWEAFMSNIFSNELPEDCKYVSLCNLKQNPRPTCMKRSI